MNGIMSHFTDMCVCTVYVYTEQDKRHSYSSSSLRLFSALSLSLTVIRTTISVIATVLVERREGEGGKQRKVRHK
jgi:hypothetical protein